MTHAFYTDEFVLPLPETHRFPMQKYRLLRDRLRQDAGWLPEQFHVPPAATDTELLRCHTREYVHRVTHGELTREEVLRVGFPWSPQLVERSRRSSGATIAAGFAACRDGIGVNLAGGTHHAFPDRGEGYCLFNDSVIASRAWQAAGLVQSVAVIDTDVHQGNGTAVCATGDESIFTFSLHGGRNYPLRKEQSDLDIELPDGADDDLFLASLTRGLAEVGRRFSPQLVIYLAGADPFAEDRLGRLSVSKAGLAQRDQLVYEFCLAIGCPVVVTMAGGYGRCVEDTVEIHFQSITTGARLMTSGPFWVSSPPEADHPEQTRPRIPLPQSESLPSRPESQPDQSGGLPVPTDQSP